MRAPAWVLVAATVALCVVLGSGTADAEKVRTNQSTKLFARPGEQSKVLVTVKSGQNMTLLRQDGRWLKVRVQNRTGYVPRSKVDMADAGGIARNTRRRPFVDGRGKKRGAGGEAPDDRIGADALGDNAAAEDEGEDEEEEPAPKKTPPKPVVKTPPAKPAATKAKASEDEDEDEDEEPAPKKTPPNPVAKTPLAKPAATKAKASEDEDEDEDEEPAPKKAPPPPPKPVATKAAAIKPGPAKAAEDDEEDDEESDEDSGEDTKPAPAAATKAKAKASEDEEDEDTGAKSDDEENPVKKDEEAERPTARVSKKVSVFEDPDAESNEEFVARPTDILYPMESKNGWTFVENAEGDGGWVQSDTLELESGGAMGGKRVIDVRARAGLMLIQQGMRTAGSNVVEVPDNYNIGTNSLTLSLGGGILIPRGKFLIGGELTYDYAKALGGGVFYDPDGPDMPMEGAHIGITVHNVNVRLLGGIDLKKKSGMTLFGRLGYRYQGFLITDVTNFTANPARLPSEVVKAPTLGAALAIPKLTDKIGIKFALDAIVFGASVKQTVGLEDGDAANVKAVVLGSEFTYRMSKAFDLMAAYNLSYMGIDFGAPVSASMRNHMGTNVKRTDMFHTVTFGVSKPF